MLLDEWGRAEIIGQFFDLNRFPAIRTDLPAIRALTDPARPVLALVGRLENDKGHRVAIAAIRNCEKYSVSHHDLVGSVGIWTDEAVKGQSLGDKATGGVLMQRRSSRGPDAMSGRW
ncbi:MAG: hypothetical protein ABIU05_05350 [Nitrospirales bacterium]